MKEVRSFEHFPPQVICPVCETSVDGEMVLLEIDGTLENGNCEAAPVHLNCAMATRFNRDAKILYTKLT